MNKIFIYSFVIFIKCSLFLFPQEYTDQSISDTLIGSYKMCNKIAGKLRDQYILYDPSRDNKNIEIINNFNIRIISLKEQVNLQQTLSNEILKKGYDVSCFTPSLELLSTNLIKINESIESYSIFDERSNIATSDFDLVIALYSDLILRAYYTFQKEVNQELFDILVDSYIMCYDVIDRFNYELTLYEFLLEDDQIALVKTWRDKLVYMENQLETSLLLTRKISLKRCEELYFTSILKLISESVGKIANIMHDYFTYSYNTEIIFDEFIFLKASYLDLMVLIGKYAERYS
jgi:hypothetical protein